MKNKIYFTALLVAGILIVINLIAEEFSIRFDFTEDNQYTLDKATKDILHELQSPVTVKAYFSEKLPPQFQKNRRDFLELLVEYKNVSNGMLVYEFLDPNVDEEVEKEALQQGIQPLMIDVREKDQMKQQKAYMGAVVQMEEQEEVIPFVQPGAAMEYSLSKAIKKVSATEKPYVGLIQGHGEPSLYEMPQVSEELAVLYRFEPVTLSDITVIPEQYKTLALIRPTDSIPGVQLKQLDDFLAKGGNLFIAFNRVDGDLSRQIGQEVTTGLETWLRNKGIVVYDDFVVDARCGAITVQQRQGFFTLSSNKSFPYLPVIQDFNDHPVTRGLEAVIMQFASSMEYSGDSTKTFTPIAFTSEKSGNIKLPVYFDIEKEWTEADFPLKHLVVGGVLEGNIAGNTHAKLIVFTDGDFAINGNPENPRPLNPDNVSMMVNGIDWLSDDTGLISLRTKAVVSRPLDELEEGTRTWLKYLNFLLPVILVIVYGLIRLQRRNNIRIKRMEENYN